ncbi:hypothetical protein PWG15_28280 (plasmid) [Ensifer adhaerens]|uniref:hypothetical protein n=1 Tax=Ensifer adhaerens TaxID=106592 RepID=UPI0023A9392A|nr:hypothetical protein [Ensifer adhaerens]WDZ79368.1 hypothetical protein PWG15_28280 [Ensifer adhaerens]
MEITTKDGPALKIVLAPDARLARQPEDVRDVASSVTEGWAIKAPLAGVFRDRHPGDVDASPLARQGSTLEAAEIAGFVEVGPILLPFIAPKAAIVSGVQARPGELVGYGDPVFMMEHAQ